MIYYGANSPQEPLFQRYKKMSIIFPLSQYDRTRTLPVTFKRDTMLQINGLKLTLLYECIFFLSVDFPGGQRLGIHCDGPRSSLPLDVHHYDARRLRSDSDHGASPIR